MGLELNPDSVLWSVLMVKMRKKLDSANYKLRNFIAILSKIIETKNELIIFWHIEEKKKKNNQALSPRIETEISAFGTEC